MADPLTRLRLDYAPLLLRYLTQKDESGLQSAYYLGRDAMRQSVGLLEVVRMHNEAFLDVLATVKDTDEARAVARSASVILMDLIASFEMTQRGFMEIRGASPDRP